MLKNTNQNRIGVNAMNLYKIYATFNANYVRSTLVSKQSYATSKLKNTNLCNIGAECVEFMQDLS